MFNGYIIILGEYIKMRKNAPLLTSALIVVALGIILMTQIGANKEKRTNEIRDKSLEESSKISSYSDSKVIRVSSKGFLDGEFDVRILIQGNETIDLDKQFMHAMSTSNITGYSADGPIRTEYEQELYVVNNTLYSKAEQTWVKQTMKEDSWSKTQLDQQIDVTKNAGVELMGTEEVNGKSAYVLEFKPDLNALMAYAIEVSKTGGSAPSPGGESKESIKEYTITEWISTETFLPLKTTDEFTLESENITTTMIVTTEYYGYNSPINSELPEEVANAIEM